MRGGNWDIRAVGPGRWNKGTPKKPRRSDESGRSTLFSPIWPGGVGWVGAPMRPQRGKVLAEFPISSHSALEWVYTSSPLEGVPADWGRERSEGVAVSAIAGRWDH